MRDFLKVFQANFPCTLITLFIKSYLHIHANLKLPNFYAQNSTQICGIMWQACKFELTKFWHSKFHSNLWGLLANMHDWLNQILTFNIPLTQACIFPLGEVNLLTLFILIQQLISNQNNIKWLIKCQSQWISGTYWLWIPIHN